MLIVPELRTSNQSAMLAGLNGLPTLRKILSCGKGILQTLDFAIKRVTC